jgi:hypothetical protein
MPRRAEPVPFPEQRRVDGGVEECQGCRLAGAATGRRGEEARSMTWGSKADYSAERNQEV